MQLEPVVDRVVLDLGDKLWLGNPRTALMARNLARLVPAERAAIRAHAASLSEDMDNL